MTEDEIKKDNKLLTLIMPVYNEGDAVIPVISTLFLTVHCPLKIIVVHDSPQDATVKTVNKLQKYFDDLYLVQNKWSNGVLNAIKTGFETADTPYVGVWVAYHLDPFGIVNAMIEKLENGCDLVSANRFTVDSSRARGNTTKKLLSHGANMVLNKIIGMPISDITTSIKVYRKSMLDSIEIETVVNGGWAVNSELAIKAAMKGYRMDEIPLEKKNITLVHGLTNFKVLKQLPTYFHWLFIGWKNRKLIKSYLQKN
ncbi:MAG: glycosyltransferase family 2 protein [Nitrospiraceae bacterium]|nr:MAG: glycosyltransferase family 2 protein [Nitrospiraceae bacterium]